MSKGKVIKRGTQKSVAPMRPSPGKEGEAAVSSRRRRIYIKERLPAILTEMKSVSDEKKECMTKHKQAQAEERKLLNRRLNFLAERLNVLREERATLIEETRQYAPSPAREEE